MNRALHAASVASLACGAACAGAAGTPAAVDTLRDAPLTEVIGARWMMAGGATLVGPAVEGGTLVLIGGRRALVGVDPSAVARVESAASPEPLQELAVVPVGDKRAVVARSDHTLYQLPDPLGVPVAIVRSVKKLRRIGAAPGVVALWVEGDDTPRYVDVATGKPASVPGLPTAPARAMVYADARRGAAVFTASGLAVTVDGGATFRLVDGVDALSATGLRLDGEGSVRAFAFGDGPSAEVDLAAATMPPMRPRAATTPAREAPLLRWVRATGRDPVEVAIGSGLDLPWGLLAASQGLVARLDRRSGLPVEVIQFAPARSASPCAAARVGDAAFVACSLAEGQGDFFDPFGLFRVGFADGHLRADKPIVVRNGEADLRASPSGGALFLRSCGADDEEDVACVKQPDGKWITVKSARGDEVLNLDQRGVGPLADGRIAFLRGAFSPDDPEPRDEASGARTGPRIVALDVHGVEATLVALDLREANVRVQSPIEQDDQRGLHLVLADPLGTSVVIAAPGADSARPQRVTGATVARLAGARGVAVGPQAVLVTSDGGATWLDADPPASVRVAVAAVAEPATLLELPDVVAASGAGIRVGEALRLGWGPTASAPAGAQVAPTNAVFDLAPSSGVAQPPGGVDGARPVRVLVCKTLGTSAAAPPPAAMSDVRETLARPPPPKGVRRDVSSVLGTRFGVFDAPAVLEVDYAREPVAPTSWTLRWLDPLSVADEVHAATWPAPRRDASGAQLTFSSTQGDRGLFAVRVTKGTTEPEILVVRARAGAPPEVRAVPREVAPAPGSEVAFGAGRTEPIVWLHGTLLVVWRKGDEPRVAARVALTGSRQLGEPSDDGAPLVVDGPDASISRVIPLSHASSNPALAPALSLDAWTPGAPLAASATRAPPCPAHASGARVWVAVASASASIDGVREAASTAAYALRTTPAGPCASRVVARLVAPARAAASDGTRMKSGPAAFVRADLEAARAEGGDVGTPKGAAVRRMSCSLE